MSNSNFNAKRKPAENLAAETFPTIENASLADPFDSIIVELGRRQVTSSDDVRRIVREITERAAEVLKVAHASLWVFNEDQTLLECKSTYDRATGKHSRGVVLESTRMSSYFQALIDRRLLVVTDTEIDEITREFFDFRLGPLGIRSLLDAPLWADGRLFGVVSFLHEGEKRIWTEREQFFAISVADVIAISLHTSDRRRFERELSFRLDFERLILTISNQLINLSSQEVEHGLKVALGQIGEFAEVDRSYLFFFGNGKGSSYHRYEWCAPGVDSFHRGRNDISIESSSRFVKKLLSGSVVHVPQVSALDPEIYLEKQDWMNEGIKSLVCVPLVSGGITVGFFGFDSLRREQTWSSDIISLLKIAGSLFLGVEERKRAEEKERGLTAQVQHSQKLESLGLLAGGIAHDFNNLLMGVLGNSELLLKSLPENSREDESLQLEFANRIHFAAKRAADLTNQLLAYSGKAQFDVLSVDLSHIIREMKPLLKTAVSKRVSLDFQLSDKQVAVLVDVTQIQQVILNLVTNASEAIGDRAGQIAVSTGIVDVDRFYLKSTYVDDELPEGKYAYIDISDTGEGMTAETVEKVFDPFFTTKFTGRGLGLAVVMGIVRSHRGAIKVFSYLHEGTTFRVLLPNDDSHLIRPLSSAAATIPEIPSGHGLVLVVDDEGITREATQDMLEVSGFKVIAAENGVTAIELFEANKDRLAAVVLDMTMPGMSGPEVFVAMNQINSKVPVLFSSGYSELESLERIRDLPIGGFIQKPFGVSALCEAVNCAIKKAVDS